MQMQRREKQRRRPFSKEDFELGVISELIMFGYHSSTLTCISCIFRCAKRCR